MAAATAAQRPSLSRPPSKSLLSSTHSRIRCSPMNRFILRRPADGRTDGRTRTAGILYIILTASPPSACAAAAAAPVQLSCLPSVLSSVQRSVGHCARARRRRRQRRRLVRRSRPPSLPPCCAAAVTWKMFAGHSLRSRPRLEVMRRHRSFPVHAAQQRSRGRTAYGRTRTEDASFAPRSTTVAVAAASVNLPTTTIMVFSSAFAADRKTERTTIAIVRPQMPPPSRSWR